MWENLSWEFLIFYHSFTHSSRHHYYASSLWDSEWQKSTRSIYQWIGWQAELKTTLLPLVSVSEGHQVLYISLHYEKQNQIYAFITTYRRKKHNKFHNRRCSNSQQKEKPRDILLFFTIHLWFRMFYILHLF